MQAVVVAQVISKVKNSQGYSGFVPGFSNVNRNSWHESQEPQMNNTHVRSDFNGSAKSCNQVPIPSQTKNDHGKAWGKQPFSRIHSANPCVPPFWCTWNM